MKAHVNAPGRMIARAPAAAMIAALCASALGVSAGPAYAEEPTGADPVLGSTTPSLRSEYATPGTYSYVVPAYVSHVTFDVYGGQGGGHDHGSGERAAGGRGGHVTATVAVTGGQAFQVDVGGKGSVGSYWSAGGGGTGGLNGDSSGGGGGSPYGGGGGGASDVREGDCATTLQCGLADRIMVAGGGGGSGQGPIKFDTIPDALGGAGGGAVGSDGTDGVAGDGLAAGGGGGRGTGGTSIMSGGGGFGGSGALGGAPGASGTPSFITATAVGGSGGNGGAAGDVFGEPGSGGGGGGGGYFGGGGGGGGGGSDIGSGYGGGGSGAGGSGYIAASASNGWSETGVQEGNGKVVVTWKMDPAISFQQSQSVTVGYGIDASVTLNYVYSPTGTVTFQVFGPGDMSCSSPLATLSASVSNARATSPHYFTTGTGTYRWTASYGGDADNNPAGPTGCGAAGSTVAVTRARPTMWSQSFPAWATTNANFGDSAHPEDAYHPTGSMTFALYDNPTCTGDPVMSVGPNPLNQYGMGGTGMLFPPRAGTFYWVPTYSGDANNEPVTGGCGADPVVVHQQMTPTFTFDLSSLAKTYGDAPFSVADAPYLVTNSTGTVSFALGQHSGGCSVTPDGTVTIDSATGEGRCVITASITADGNYWGAGPISQGFGIARATPTFTNIAIGNGTFDGQPHAASADVTGVGGENLGAAEVTYELRTGTAPNYTYGAATGSAPTAPGTYRATFTFSGGDNYVATSDNSHVLTIGREPQTITFPALPDRTFGDAPFTVGATADSGLPIVLAASGKCGVSGAYVHLTGAGTCMVLASQPGDAQHDPARSVSQTFTVAKADPTISVTGYGETYDGTSRRATGTATGVYGESLAGLDVSATAHTDAGTYTDTWTFIDATGNYNGTSGTVVDRIDRVPVTIDPTSGQSMVYGSTPPSDLPYTLSGLVNGETEDGLRAAGALTGEGRCSTEVTSRSPVGTYPISCTTGSLEATNYSFEMSSWAEFAVTPATLTVTANDWSAQYSDPVTLGYTISGFADGEELATSDVTGTPGVATTATMVGGNVVSPPGTYAITISEGSLASENYEFEFVDATLTVVREDARAVYSGDTAFSGAAGGSATVTLKATVRDISAVSGDPVYDATPGSISHATVAFIDRASGETLCTATVSPVNASDATVGAGTCTATVDIAATGGTRHTIGIVVGGWYTDGGSTQDTVIGVAPAALENHFIAGAGYLVEAASAGQYRADARTRSVFAFEIRSRQGATRPQGSVELVFRRGGHIYEIRSTAITALGVTPSPCSMPASASPCTASVVGKAILRDITHPWAPRMIGGNFDLQLSMTDYGHPTHDTIGITLYNGSTLLFSSNWNGTKTVEQTLGGGNLAVR